MPFHPTTRPYTVVLAVLCLAQLMVVLDVTIVNVSLASIQDDLGLTTANVQYVVTGYLVTLGGFLLVAGRVADLFGRRRTLMVGTALFAASSLAAAMAQSAWQLLVPRALQGIGGALITTSALSLLTTLFAEGPARNRALGSVRRSSPGASSLSADATEPPDSTSQGP